MFVSNSVSKMGSHRSKSLRIGLSVVALLTLGSLLPGCSPPGTPDAVVGNQGTKRPDETGSVLDRDGKVISNASTGAGDRKGLGN